MSKKLIFIRHAPIVDAARLCGRTDVSARIESDQIGALRHALPQKIGLICSPAKRCVQTAKALFPNMPELHTDPLLWEQNFGDHDGLPYSEIPDIGILPREQLVNHRPPNGESFSDVCARVWPFLDGVSMDETQENHVIIAHAGVVRAALAWHLGQPCLGIGFEIAPLSVTRLRVGSDGPVSIISVNERHNI